MFAKQGGETSLKKLQRQINMIFGDFETTGLVKASANRLEDQPEIIEYSLVKTDDDLNFVSEIEGFLKPSFPIPEVVTKITNINDDMVKNAPQFPSIYPDFCSMFLGETTFVAHNCNFDLSMVYLELLRIDKVCHFPWPMHWICTVEKSYNYKDRRLKLSELHEMATRQPHSDKAHRAKEDVYALIRCFKWMREKGDI